MLCKKPYMLGVLPCGCGQCLPCRINRRRLWTHRMMLESVKHVSSSFVTLTYSQEKLPSGSTLVPDDARNWLKRLRKALSPHQIRYYLVGEYGDESWRPHYHAAIFGLDPILGGGDDGRKGVVAETWKAGHTYTGDLTPQSASYICGYVTKKLTSKKDPRLMGRYPEFARMSLKPGIGAPAMMDVASHFGDHSLEYIAAELDVPSSLQVGKKKQPLGRYLKSKLREALGYGRVPIDGSLQRFGEKMRQLYEDEKYAAKEEKREIKYVESLDKQRILNLESRFKIHNKRGSI